MSAKKKMPLHTKILLGLLAGLVYGALSIWLGWNPEFTVDYIKPVGTIFVNALKLIAMPLILASLIVGVANLGDVSHLSRLGGKTILLYLGTTVIAITIGLGVVNLIKPGELIDKKTRTELLEIYSVDAESKTESAKEVKDKGPLEPLINIVPSNIFRSLTDNRNMLQIVVFSIILGIGLLHIPAESAKPVIDFFNGLNDVILKVIDFIMAIAPYGVFSLIASLIVEIAGKDPSKAIEVLSALGAYALTVLLGLGLMILAIYPSLLRVFKSIPYRKFFAGIRDAQLVAFSTSSSSATLPVTLECVKDNLGVKEEVASFVLPLGATINMDGTSLYQSVAAVFIAQAMGIELTLVGQLTIILTALLASIGSAGVPGAGMVMLVIVLEAVGIPGAGLALIIAPDRPLDMCRTMVNVTGDATVCTAVDSMDSKNNR